MRSPNDSSASSSATTSVKPFSGVVDDDAWHAAGIGLEDHVRESLADQGEHKHRRKFDFGDNILLFFGGLCHKKGPNILADLVCDVDRQFVIMYADPLVNLIEADVVEWKRSVEIVDRLEYILEPVARVLRRHGRSCAPLSEKQRRSGSLWRAVAVGTPTLTRKDPDYGDLVDQYGLGETFDPDDENSFQEHVLAVLDNCVDIFAFRVYHEQQRPSFVVKHLVEQYNINLP